MKDLRLKDLPYWIRTHTINKYHLIDIRQQKNSPDQYAYRWGWIDPSEKIVLAIFNIFCEFFEEEFFRGFCAEERDGKWVFLDKNFLDVYDELKNTKLKEEDFKLSDGSFDEDTFKSHEDMRERHLEIFEIYKWWKIDRLELCKKDDETSIMWYRYNQSLDKNYLNWTEDQKNMDKLLFKKSMDAEELLRREEELMLIKIIKIRGSLWE